MGTLANSDDISSGSSLFAKTISIFKEKNHFLILTYDPSIYTVDHPHFIVCSFMENSIGLKRVNM